MNTAYIPLLLMLFLLILFTWNKWRYDLVAIFGLLLAVSINIVPVEKAFLGFAHPAVILVAAALMISQALQSSGALEALLGLLPVEGRSLPLQLLMVCSVTVFLSAFINNVAAVALMIPFVISLAYKSDRSARLYLMPIAFSSLLGGMITLIGTPPNIIIATFRGQLPDQARFSMFDFTPIGLSLSVIGLLFIAFATRFLISAPKSTQQESMLDTLRDFLTDMTVNQDSPLIGSTLREFIETHEEITVLGLRRDQKTQLFPSPYERFKENDILIIEAKSEAISLLSEEKGLSTQSEKVLTNFEEDEEVIVVEVIIPSQSKALGNSSKNLDFRWRYQVNVLGVARAGHRLSRSLSDVVFAVGDIILLQGTKDNISKTMKAMNWIFLKERTEAFKMKKKAIALPIGIFMAAILGSYFKFMDITIAFVGCALVYVLLGYLSPKKMYKAVEWPVIVLLACLIPIGESMESAGSLQLIAEQILSFGKSMGPISVLVILMLVSVTLTNVVNNAAAAIVMAPVAIKLATSMDVSADTFLMAIAVSSSAAFITPIAHQSNTLVLEPGNYKFKEYSYLGFPVTLLILGAAIPLLLWIWPLS